LAEFHIRSDVAISRRWDAVTNSEGNYQIRDVPPGDYAIRTGGKPKPEAESKPPDGKPRDYVLIGADESVLDAKGGEPLRVSENNQEIERNLVLRTGTQP
jgi:hypothetical protein